MKIILSVISVLFFGCVLGVLYPEAKLAVEIIFNGTNETIVLAKAKVIMGFSIMCLIGFILSWVGVWAFGRKPQ